MESFPNRPLKPSEVEALAESETLEEVVPVSDTRQDSPQVVNGLVLVGSGQALAMAFISTMWRLLEKKSLDIDGPLAESTVIVDLKGRIESELRDFRYSNTY